MSQVQEILKILNDWRAQPGKNVTQALQNINKASKFQGQELDELLQGLINFHRTICRVEETLIENVKWFELCITSKAKLKKLKEAAEKHKVSQPFLEKKKNPSPPIVYPEELTAGRVGSDEKWLKYLYKSFVTNFEEAIKHPKTTNFIVSTFKEVKYRYDDRMDSTLNKKLLSICTRLAKQSSKQSKKRMLSGEITPKELSNDHQELYFDQKTKDNIKRIQMAQLERSRMGFYADMKKQINKDACELCTFCNKNAAYCEDQKQIRASDQPMTRFMRCNACQKRWTS